jgi:hypothetical protein
LRRPAILAARYHLFLVKGASQMKASVRLSLLLVTVAAAVAPARARTACTPTGFVRDSINLTAALINPASVTSTVDATGCNIGVYYSPGSTGDIRNATIFGANYFGVVVDGASGSTSVDIINSVIHDIGESPLNGAQHGVGIYYASFSSAGSASGKVAGNHLYNYQKGGLVFNGPGTNVIAQNNIVEGEGPVSYIAQNGIQFGYGASGSATKNTVTGHSYTGSSTVSGGIIVVGGPGYGTCLDGNPCQFTTGIQIVQNVVRNNDIGIFLTNLEADGSAPVDATNIKAVNNEISNSAVTNGYVYQAGVSDVGNNDKIINNKISGAGYATVNTTTVYTIGIDADVSFTNRPKVHANK